MDEVVYWRVLPIRKKIKFIIKIYLAQLGLYVIWNVLKIELYEFFLQFKTLIKIIKKGRRVSLRPLHKNDTNRVQSDKTF